MPTLGYNVFQKEIYSGYPMLEEKARPIHIYFNGSYALW